MSGAMIALSVLIAWVLESALGQWLTVRGARPDFVLAVVAYAALTRRGRWGTITGVCAGLLVDILSPAPFGAHAAGGAAVGWVLGNLWRAVYRDRWESQVLSLVAAVLISDVVVLWVGGSGPDASVLRILLARSLPSGVYTALLCPPLFALIAHLAHLRIRWDSGARTS